MRTLIFFLFLSSLATSPAHGQSDPDRTDWKPAVRIGVNAYATISSDAARTGFLQFERSWNGGEVGIRITNDLWLNASYHEYDDFREGVDIAYYQVESAGQIYTLGIGTEGRIWSIFEWTAGVDGFYRKEENAGESGNDTPDPAYSWRQESNSEFGVQVHGGIRINFLKYFYIKGQLHIRPFWYYSRDAQYSDTSGRETSGSTSKFKILGPQMNQHLVTLGVQI
jgi:hypothetical protein